MSIILIVPPSEYIVKNNMPPLGLLSIASVLENAGFKVEIIDCNVMAYNLEQVNEIIKQKKPEMIGITATTYTRFDAINVAIISKSAHKKSVVVVGGPHFSFVANETLENIPDIDIVVRGEGEFTMLELAENIKKNINFKNVLGISFRDGDKIINNKKRPLIKNLDVLPISNRKNIPLKKYDQQMEFLDIPCTNIICGRGCPNRCIFCSSSAMWGCNVRMRSAKHVIDEIEILMKEYKFKAFYFVDDTLTFSKKHILELCEEIKTRKLKFKWFTNIRVDTVNKEILKEMKNAGCFYVAFGVESGSPNVLKTLNKKIRVDDVINCAINCKDLDIKTKAYFTFSNPDETEKEIEQTFELMKKLSICVDIIAPSVLSVFPGTMLEKRAKKIGCLPTDFNWTTPFHKKEYKTIGTVPNTPVYIENMDMNMLIKIRARVLVEDMINQKTGSFFGIVIKGLKSLLNVRNINDLKILLLIIKYKVF